MKWSGDPIISHVRHRLNGVIGWSVERGRGRLQILLMTQFTELGRSKLPR